MKHFVRTSALALAALGLASGLAQAGSARATLMHYEKLARAAGHFPAGGFSAKRGSAFFHARHGGGRPATPSCTTCHTKSPRNWGRTRAGKRIAPVALSKTPDRFSDLAKVEKWFHRNCRSVLGRDCTVREKGDYIAYMMSQ